MRKKFFVNFAVLLLLMFISGLIGIGQGQDAIWDFFNYHFYNGYAFVNGRVGYDIIPAGIHTYFNPLLDAFNYLLIRKLNSYTLLVQFLKSVWYGAFVFFILKTVWLFFRETKDGRRVFFPLTALVAVSGAAAISLIGVSSGEMEGAVLFAASLYFYFLFIKEQKIAWLIICALCAGTGFGFKLTGGPYVLALCAAFFFNLRATKKPFVLCATFFGVLFAGFLLSNGYWMYLMAKYYHNPFFPFFNKIFRSEYFELVNYRDTRNLPRNVLEVFSKPFLCAKKCHMVLSTIPYRDLRGALALICMPVSAWYVFKNRIPATLDKKLLKTLLIMGAVFYFSWILAFSIMRYALMFEAMCALIISSTLILVLKPTASKIVIFLLTPLLVFYTIFPDWRKAEYSPTVIELIDFKDVEDNSLVLVQGSPISFVLPFFNSTSRFVGLNKYVPEEYPVEFRERAAKRNVFPDYFYTNAFDNKIKETIQEHKGPVYLFTIKWPPALNNTTLNKYGLYGEEKDCIIFKSNVQLYSAPFQLCRLAKYKE